MLLDLSQLDGGRLEKTFRVASGDPLLAGYEADLVEPLAVGVELTNPTAGTYVMSARLQGNVTQACRRCLEPVTVPVRHRFRVIYQQPSRERGDEPQDESLIPLAAKARHIDIRGEVRDRLFLETERFPVCREECQGLCPTCGQNLNEGDCGCSIATADARWTALRGLAFDDRDAGQDQRPQPR
ncbi:MAG: DUF177 domain-containing protein [Gemmatimonadota bacterium]